MALDKGMYPYSYKYKYEDMPKSISDRAFSRTPGPRKDLADDREGVRCARGHESQTKRCGIREESGADTRLPKGVCPRARAIPTKSSYHRSPGSRVSEAPGKTT